MYIEFELGRGNSIIAIQRITGDSKVSMSKGWAPEAHGWEGEHRLFYRLQQELKKLGIILVKKRAQEDGHLFGMTETPYLKCPMPKSRKNDNQPHIYIFDGNWELRNAAKAYNAKERIVLHVVGDIYPDYPQEDWMEILENLCRSSNTPCKILQNS